MKDGNISVKRNVVEREILAGMYYGHLIFKGEDGLVMIYTNSKSISPPPGTCKVWSPYTWSEATQLPDFEPIYAGDEVRIKF